MASTDDRLNTRAGGLVRRLKAGLFLIRILTERKPASQNQRLTESRKKTRSGVEYDLYEPAKPAGKTCILVPGLTLEGERDTRLVNFARALAETGVRGAAIALPGLKSCRFIEQDVRDISATAKHLHEKYGGAIGIAAFSFGAGLSLAAAAEPETAAIINPLLLFGPYYYLSELRQSMRAFADATPASDEEWDDFIWLKLILAYPVMADLALDEDEKAELRELLGGYCHETSLERKREFYERVLKKLDPEILARAHSDEDAMKRLSPEGRMAQVSADVFILHDAFDRLIPPEHSSRIMEEAARSSRRGTQRLLVTPLLSHVNARYAMRVFDLFAIIGMMSELFRSGQNARQIKEDG